MLISELSEEFIISFLKKDPCMDRSKWWPIVKKEMTKVRDIFNRLFERMTVSDYRPDRLPTLHYESKKILLNDRCTQPTKLIEGNIRSVALVTEKVWLLQPVSRKDDWAVIETLRI